MGLPDIGLSQAAR